MGRRRRIKDRDSTRSQTLPPSPSHSLSSSSSSDFEFTISISPRKSSSTLCPADELFYKGQLLPLHLSPRISMVRTLLLASSSTSSSSTTCDTTTTASRDSTGSASSSSSCSSSGNDSNLSFNSNDLALLAADQCDSSSSSSRPSSVTEEYDEFRKLNGQQIKKAKYFSLTRLFKKDLKNQDSNNNNNSNNNSSVKRMSATAKEVLRKYLKKVKPLYERFSQKQQQQKMGVVVTKNNNNTTCVRSVTVRDHIIEASSANKNTRKENSGGGVSLSFSGNLRYPMRKKSCVSSCPSSMRSSPSHSGILSSRGGFSGVGVGVGGGSISSMEELQSAIQGAIAHCKNSMNKSSVSHGILS